MGGSSSQTIGQRYFAKLTTFIGNPIEKLIGINFDNRGWIFKPDNDESFLRVERPNLYGDKEGGVAGFIDIHTGTANQLPNTTYSADFPKVSGYPFQSYLVFRGLGKKTETTVTVGGLIQSTPKHYNNSFYHGNSGYMKEMLLWPKRIHVRNDGRAQWYDLKSEIPELKNGDSEPLNNMTIENFTSSYYTSLNGGISASFSNAPYTRNFITGVAAGFGSNSNVVGYADSDNDYNAASNFYIESYYDLVNVPVGNVHIDINLDFAGVNINAFIISGDATNSLIFTNIIDGINNNGLPCHKTLATGEIKSNGNLRIYIKAVGHEQVTTTQNLVIAQIKTGSITYPEPFNLLPGLDINPIHKVREILTDDTAMNKPESDVNDVNFKKAADVLYAEKLGISWSVTEKSCLEAINELCGHIEAGVRMNRQTGLYEMVLFRDDWFNEDEIHTLPVNKIKSMNLDGATSADELINKLNVSYYNQSAIKDSSFSIAENAAIRNLKGHENADDVKFPYFMNQRNAVVVAQWKLKQMSTPVWQGTLTTGFYEARKWNRYDLLKLEWPRKWKGTILVRIMKINLGTGTEVSIDFVEVVPYSSDLSSSIVIDTPVDTTPKPPLPALFKAFELSYLEAVQLNGQKAVDEALAYNPDAGYAAVIAQRPQSNSLNALMYTDIGNDFERAGAIVYSETAELDQSLSKMDHAFIVKKAGDIDMVSTGTQITVNNEIMVYQSYDEETGLLTVKRGALDTVPQNHLAGSVLYFADDFITVDPTEYVTGEIINVKTLTTTPSGILSLDDVDAQQVEIQARAIRPYPPANVKINGEYYPQEIETDLILSWVDRNRLQQTGGEIIGWFDGGVTIEPNTQTHLVITEHDADNVALATNNANVTGTTSYTMPISTMQPNTRTLEIVLKTIRDGFECLQPFEYVIELSQPFSAPYNLQVEFKNG